MADDFVETLLDIGMPVQAGGPKYRTKIIRTGYEFEKRWSQQSVWLYEGNLSEILLDQDQVRYLIAFLNARQGKRQGFRFRFWADCQVTAAPKDLGGDCSTQGVTTPLRGDGERQMFHLLKKYQQGEHVTYKPIHKPDTVQVFVGGELTLATYSRSTGRLFLRVPPEPNQRITWSGTFDLPVRFDTDTIPAIQQFVQDPDQNVFYEQELALFQVDSLPLIEIEMPLIEGTNMPSTELKESCEYRLELGPLIGPTDAIGPSHNIFTKRLDSGFERRTAYQSEPLLKGEINQSLLEDTALEYALCFFHCRRGRAQTFRWKYWADYKATATRTNLDEFTSIQGVFTPAPDGVVKTFKFQKKYIQFGRAVTRGILNVVRGTVVVYRNGVAQSALTINAKKGLVTFNIPPPSGAALAWSGEHDIEMRFDSDQATLKSALLDPDNTVETAPSVSYQFQNMAVVEVLPTFPVTYTESGESYEGVGSGQVCGRDALPRCQEYFNLAYQQQIISTGNDLQMRVTFYQTKTINLVILYPSLSFVGSGADGYWLPRFADIWTSKGLNAQMQGAPDYVLEMTTYPSSVQTSEMAAFRDIRSLYIRYREFNGPAEPFVQLNWSTYQGCPQDI